MVMGEAFIRAVVCVPWTSSVVLAPRGFGPADVISVVFAPLGQSQLTEISKTNVGTGT